MPLSEKLRCRYAYEHLPVVDQKLHAIETQGWEALDFDSKMASGGDRIAAVEENTPAKEIVLENLMHEFGHVLQEWLGLEFDEEQVEKFVRSYGEKYGLQGYEEVHGDQSLTEK